MVISSISGSNLPVTAIVPSQQIDSSVVRQVEKKSTVRDIDNVMSTEQYVKKYFKDIPIMVHIARCESTFRQLTSQGDIHRGRVNNSDVGVMQINEFYHGDTAEQENLDIYTIEGNVAYARDLYERQGTKPWNSSKPCWGKYLSDSSKDLAVK